MDKPGDSVFLDSESVHASARPGNYPRVEIDSSPLYELLLTLLVFTYEVNAYSFRVGPEWFEGVRARASSELLAAYRDLSPGCWLWERLLVLACKWRSRSLLVNAGPFIERLQELDAQRLYEFLLGHDNGSSAIDGGVIEEAAAGNHDARLKLGKVLFPDEPEHDGTLALFLRRRPAEAKETLLRIITGWYTELFRAEERELAVRLATEARTKRIIGSSAPSRLLRASTIGLQYFPRRSVSRVLLVPAIVTSPCVITIRFGATRAFFYPLADEPNDNDELSSRLVKIHRALADLERLHILQALIRSERTLPSLSRELGQHHMRLSAQLVILRDAGLVTLRMDERRQTFAIRPNLPSVVFRTMQAFLPDVPGPGEPRPR